VKVNYFSCSCFFKKIKRTGRNSKFLLDDFMHNICVVKSHFASALKI
jgi:hypothetical protein